MSNFAGLEDSSSFSYVATLGRLAKTMRPKKKIIPPIMMDSAIRVPKALQTIAAKDSSRMNMRARKPGPSRAVLARWKGGAKQLAI